LVGMMGGGTPSGKGSRGDLQVSVENSVLPSDPLPLSDDLQSLALSTILS
jgi:hypothetical protein